MSAEILPPRANPALLGQERAEATLLAAWTSGRLPHAWLLAGPRGIGKATLAYRIATHLVSAPPPGGGLFGDDPGPMPYLNPSDAALVRAGSHPRLCVIRRSHDDKGKARNQIVIDDVRCLRGFFQLSAADGGHRVVIVDPADDLNPNAANAILKLLEEPPARSLFLLISHTPGRLLPTIRSRCRRLTMKTLTTGEVAQTLASLSQAIPELDPAQFASAAEASQGSVGRAHSLLIGGEDGLEILQLTRELLSRLPAVESASVAALGDKLRGDNLGVFAEAVEDWLAQAATGAGEAARLAHYAEAWEKVRRATATAEIYNLDRKPLVFQVFTMLSEAARG